MPPRLARPPASPYVIIEALARPRQRTEVRWQILCGILSRERERRGRLTAKTPVKREFAPTVRRPDACAVHTTARLASTGRLTLNVLQRL